LETNLEKSKPASIPGLVVRRVALAELRVDLANVLATPGGVRPLLEVVA